MTKFARAVGVLGTLVATTLLGALPAAAAPSTSPAAPTGYACLDQKAGYQPEGVCQLFVLKAQAECRDNVPWLDYALQPEGAPDTTATLVWGDPNGTHDTMANVPLSGSVMWPGTQVDTAGQVTDWPGWSLVNGVWVQHDQWDWMRPQVPLTFQATSTATVTVAYPDTVVPCGPPRSAVLAADDPVTPTSAVLAATGSSNAEPLMLVAAGVLLIGSLALGLRAVLRRRAATR
jgi:hypothetical protein